MHHEGVYPIRLLLKFVRCGCIESQGGTGAHPDAGPHASDLARAVHRGEIVYMQSMSLYCVLLQQAYCDTRPSDPRLPNTFPPRVQHDAKIQQDNRYAFGISFHPTDILITRSRRYLNIQVQQAISSDITAIDHRILSGTEARGASGPSVGRD